MKKILICECKRCKHRWATRKEQKPRVCPKCKSPYWDVEKINLQATKVLNNIKRK